MIKTVQSLWRRKCRSDNEFYLGVLTRVLDFIGQLADNIGVIFKHVYFISTLCSQLENRFGNSKGLLNPKSSNGGKSFCLLRSP